MIKYKTGSIFDSKKQYLVNPINCVGVMGRGLAAEFRMRYPEMFKWYQEECRQGRILTGFVYPWEKKVMLFPTKNDWRYKSKYIWIEQGLMCMKEYFPYSSFALPRLGCGLGGLEWLRVKDLIEKHLDGMNVEVWSYEVD